MKKMFILFVILLIIVPVAVKANIICNDGTTSPSCQDCHRGCCSRHGGCSVNSNSSTNYSNNSSSSSTTVKKIYGCTNKDALNYNSSANFDDGSCISKIYGCMDTNADNYLSNANVSDHSCLYTSEEVFNKKIKYKTKYSYNKFKKEGKVLRKGVNGRKEIRYVVVKNEQGQIISKSKKNTKIIKKAVDQILSTKSKKSKIKKNK